MSDGQTLQELAEATCLKLVAHGTPLEVAKAFVCFRFHPQCAWGLGRISLGDVSTYAIVRPVSEDFQNVECVFMVADKRLPLSDLTGLETIPEKKYQN